MGFIFAKNMLNFVKLVMAQFGKDKVIRNVSIVGVYGLTDKISGWCEKGMHYTCRLDWCECECHTKLILVCGDRYWSNYELIKRVIMELAQEYTLKIINGGCCGADKIRSYVCEELNIIYQEVPANWAMYGKAAGPRRNRIMLDLKPDLVLAFHDKIEESKGTKDCINEAKKRKIKVKLYTNGDKDV